MRRILRPVPASLIIVAALLTINTLRGNRFRSGTDKTTRIAAEGGWILDEGPAASRLIIEKGLNTPVQSGSDLHLPVSSIGSLPATRIIRNLEKPVQISGTDRRSVVTAWIILTQMGIDCLFKEPVEDEERLKHEFRPDTAMASTGIL